MQVESGELRIANEPLQDSRVLEARYFAAFRRLKPAAPPPTVSVQFRRYASASAKIRLERGILEVKISDVLARAPDEVHAALVEILVNKLCNLTVPVHSTRTYRQYLRRPDVRRDLQHIRRIRGRKKVDPPAGQYHNLDQVFDEINDRYFFGLMPKPALGWSLRPSKTLLGHFDPNHNTIVISRSLDRRDIPKLVVDYVMYHEMLHIKHPTEQRGSRRCVHTKAFRLEEQRFEGWERVKRLLSSLL